MRVTMGRTFQNNLRNLEQRGEAHQNQLEVASTGKRLRGLATDPTAYTEVLSKRTSLGKLDSYQRGLTRAINQASFADSSLQGAQNDLSRALELSLAGASETLDQEGRDAIALELRGILSSIHQVSNVKYDGQPLFGGGLNNSPLFDDAGTYAGGSRTPEIIAGEGFTMEIGMTGDEIFNPAGGVNIFGTLDAIATALESGDPATARLQLDNIEGAIDQLSAARSFYGSVIVQSDSLSAFYDASTIRETEAKSQVEDADMLEAYSDLTRLQTAFEASLQISASIGKKNLFDFL